MCVECEEQRGGKDNTKSCLFSAMCGVVTYWNEKLGNDQVLGNENIALDISSLGFLLFILLEVLGGELEIPVRGLWWTISVGDEALRGKGTWIWFKAMGLQVFTYREYVARGLGPLSGPWQH